MVVHVDYGSIPGARREPDMVAVEIAGLRRKPTREIDQPTVEWLAESFQEVGQLQAIVIDPEQNVLAGEHRIRAGEKLGWPRINAVVCTLDQLRARLATLDENLVRNPGTELERSEQLRERKEIYETLHSVTGHGGERAGAGRKSSRQNGDLKHEEGEPAEPAPKAERFTRDTAAKTGQSERGVQRRLKIAEDLDPKAKRLVAKSPLADQITELEQLAKLEPEQQVEVARRAVEAGTTVKRAVKDLRREERIAEVKAYTPPKGKYPVVFRDPAWPYEDQLAGDGARGGTPYPQATIDEICTQVPPADDNCVLFLCTTNAMLVDLDAPVQRVLRAWGFMPKGLITWKKDRMGVGRYARNITEHIVVAVKGAPVLDLPEHTSWFEAPRGAHSEKPEALYELIEKFCPARPCFEGDARPRSTPRPGWVRSGAELPAPESPPPVACICTHALGQHTRKGCAKCICEMYEPAEQSTPEGPAHQWQRENPLSAPARALYRCLLCDLQHRGQETPQPYGPCRSRELAPPPAPRPPGWSWREVNIHPSVRRAHAMAWPGEITTLCGAELSSGKPATPDRMPCEYCLAEIAQPTGPYTLLATAAHRTGEDICPGCGVTRKENNPEKGGVGWQHGSVGDRPALSQCQACVAKGVPRVAVSDEDQAAWRKTRDREFARAKKGTKGKRGRAAKKASTWAGPDATVVMALSELRVGARALGFSGTLKVAGKTRQAMCLACNTKVVFRANEKDATASRSVLENLQRHQEGCPAKLVRTVKVQAGSYREGRGAGAQCVSVSTRKASADRCKRVAAGVVKGSGRLFSVCSTHGQMAMRTRELSVALEGGR